MKLNGQELYDFFIEKNILVLYHANTIRTSLTYFQQNGLLSRGAVESLGLDQTVQSSDQADVVLNVWNDIFLDSTDLHTLFRRQNHYGPVLFEFNIDLVLDSTYDIWITKDNPIYWDKDSDDSIRYFQNVDELRSSWEAYPRQKMMITLRNNSTPILFEHVRKVIVDDPRVTINGEEGEKIHVFNRAHDLMKSCLKTGHVLNGKFIVRECSGCYCRDNYLNEMSVDKLKRLFL